VDILGVSNLLFIVLVACNSVPFRAPLYLIAYNFLLGDVEVDCFIQL